MQELSWVAEMMRIWLEGGSWADIQASDGFLSIVALAAFLIPSSLIALGIGMTDWHETPLGMWMGATPPNENWVERARDLDKDGLADF
jgi:hypothetical protein